MAGSPNRLRIRSYVCGFGDSFLLTFFYEENETRNVLIDFGSTKTSKFGPVGGLLAIAEQIRKDCGGKLDVVVATHRHADHISGFAEKPGEVIASLEPELVIQPWTEDPNLQPDARSPTVQAEQRTGAKALVSGLANMQSVAAAVRAELPRLEQSSSVRKSVREQLAFLGETNLANAGAVRNLMTMANRAVYASFGTELPLTELLPGVGVEVLGPPTLEQSAEIATQRATDPDEFWHLAAGSAVATTPDHRLQPLFPNAAIAGKRIPQEARWVIPEIERMRSEEMLAIVRVLDSALNNTSLILLLEIGETRLLFPGDAQIENWRYALFTAPDHEDIRKRLATVRLYKVGHHGSLNATPKTLWNSFEHRGERRAEDRLVTMLSTLAGKHGSVDRGTEVPRRTLLAELERLTELHDTERRRNRREFWEEVELKL